MFVDYTRFDVEIISRIFVKDYWFSGGVLKTTQHANCLYCHSAAEIKFRTKDFNRKVSNENFDYYHCSSCGLIFLNPVPRNLGDFYTTEYYSVPMSMEALGERTKIDRYKMDILRQYIKQGRLLEIGPSIGGFAYLAKEADFEVETIEMDERCCHFLENVLNIRAFNTGDIKSVLQNSQPYNAVAMWHVIEHLPNLWETLQVISERLVSGGILILSAPNPEALQFRLLKRFWGHVDAPRHLELIPHRLLTEFLAKQGLSTVLMTTQDEGSVSLNSFGWATSLGYFFNHSLLKRGMRGIGRVITKVLSPVENRNGLGSTYTMVFQKGAQLNSR